MLYILSFITIIASLTLLSNKGIKRFLIFIVCISILPFGLEIVPKLHAPRLLVIAFCLSIIFRKSDLKVIQDFPFKKLLFVLFISHIAIGIADVRLNMIQSIYKPTIAFIESFGCLLLGYVSCTKCSDEKSLFNVLNILAIIVSVYSLFSLTVGYDAYNSIFEGSDSLNGDRLRIASFFYNSHVGGLAMSIYLLILLYFNNKYGKISYVQAPVILLFIALLLTGSRSSFLDFAIGCIFFYIPVFFTSRHKALKFISAVIIIGILSSIIGETIISQFTDIFKDDGGKTGGSNFVMRLQQLYYSWQLFLEKPWFGHGFQYFWEVIKIQRGDLGDLLLGAESYIFILLIERGAIQILLITLFFIAMFRYFLKQKCIESYLCIAITSAFLVNSIATGNLYKWIFVMPFIGYYIRYLQLKQA